MRLRDRLDAAGQLATALAAYRGRHAVVLAIPRGAVPMGLALARALEADLDIVLVHKLGAPGNPEFAVGAVDEHGTVTLGEGAGLVGGAYLDEEARRQRALLAARRARYGRRALPLEGRIVIVVDDGLATGATMRAALASVRARHPGRLVCAVPVAARDSLREVAALADEVVCLSMPEPFISVGQHYLRFDQVGDDEVAAALAQTSPVA